MNNSTNTTNRKNIPNNTNIIEFDVDTETVSIKEITKESPTVCNVKITYDNGILIKNLIQNQINEAKKNYDDYFKSIKDQNHSEGDWNDIGNVAKNNKNLIMTKIIDITNELDCEITYNLKKELGKIYSIDVKKKEFVVKFNINNNLKEHVVKFDNLCIIDTKKEKDSNQKEEKIKK
jgi:hypothetical protein